MSKRSRNLGAWVLYRLALKNGLSEIEIASEWNQKPKINPKNEGN